MPKPEVQAKQTVDGYDFVVDGDRLNEMSETFGEKIANTESGQTNMMATNNAMTGGDGSQGYWTGVDAAAYADENGNRIQLVGQSGEAMTSVKSAIDSAAQGVPVLESAIAAAIAKLK